MRRGDIGGGSRREPGKCRRHDDIGGENDHREKFCHGTSLVGGDWHSSVRIPSLLET
jgi:hypothetical protein